MRRVDTIAGQGGKKATFIVNVQYRQHSSWQGEVFWIEGKKSCSFRSVLELVKLIDSTTDDSAFTLIESEKTGTDTMQMIYSEGE